MKSFLSPGSAFPAALFSHPLLATCAHAQGCVAAHSPQPVISGSIPPPRPASATPLAPTSLHGLTITTGFRVYNSYKHYVGTVYQEQRAINHNAIVNHVDLFELDLNYQMTPRWSAIASMPALEATRHGQSSPLNVYRSGGLGDVTVGVSPGCGVHPQKATATSRSPPSSNCPPASTTPKGTKTSANGTKTVQPFDESIQPGDGTWGFSLATQAYREFYWLTSGYFTGSWLFNPQDTTGVQDLPCRARRGRDLRHRSVPLARRTLTARYRRSKPSAALPSALAAAWKAFRFAMHSAQATASAVRAMSSPSSPA